MIHVMIELVIHVFLNLVEVAEMMSQNKGGRYSHINNAFKKLEGKDEG